MTPTDRLAMRLAGVAHMHATGEELTISDVWSRADNRDRQLYRRMSAVAILGEHMSREQIEMLVQQLADQCRLTRPALAVQLIEEWLRRRYGDDGK